MILFVALASAETLDYAAAVDRALAQGVDVRQAAITLAEADAALRVSHHAWDPDLGATASVTTSVDTAGQTGAGLSADLVTRIPVFAGGASSARLDRADADRTARAADLDATRQGTILAVADALLAVEEARALVVVQEGQLVSERAVAELVEAQVAGGTRTRADALQQRAAVATAESDLVLARRDFADATLDAVRLLRLDPVADWTFVGPAAPPALVSDLDGAVARALVARPEVRAGEATVVSATATTREQRAGLRPAVDVSAGLSTDVGEDLSASGQAWAALDLNVPILDRGVTRSNVEVAQLGESSATLERDDLHDAVVVDVRRAWNAREAAGAVQVAARARRAAAAAALQVVQDRYEAGAALFVELAAARAAVVQAERAEATAEVDVVRAGFGLAWAVGELENGS
jgi:outer membrane protein